MSWHRSDRVSGFALMAVAAAIAIEARTFDVRFLTDPLGPKALPLFVAGLVGVGGLLLVARPDTEPVWPAGRTWIRLAAALASFSLYAVLLAPLGFLVSTTLVVTALSLVFAGPLWRSLASAVILSGVMYLVFVYGLGLSLPLGTLFLVRAGS
jgi:putative tricarboxylic transport membrane protein